MNRTFIGWTDFTWNPVTGCTKVSPGCKHCYAERTFPRIGKGRDFTDVQFHSDRIWQPSSRKKPARIFVCSMADIAHEAITDWQIARIWAMMANCPQHTFQVLTKRPKRLHTLLSQESWWAKVEALTHTNPPIHLDRPLENVHLGVSMESSSYEERLDYLVDTPAAVHFVSLEPLLEPIDILHLNALDWVIVGGESGPQARPCDTGWILSIIKQCEKAGVPCFVKQLGRRVRGINEGAPFTLKDTAGADPSEWPAILRVQQFPMGNG